MKRKTPEGYLLAGILDYLAAKRIFAMRMNSGLITLGVEGGRRRTFRAHDPGTADVLAIQRIYPEEVGYHFSPVWIEAKAPNGRQSPLQKSFQQKVEAEGHKYVLCYGIEDLEAAGL